MKTKILIGCLLVCFLCKAQYPAPHNFSHSVDGYVHIFEMGYCGGKLIVGPEHCSSFHWGVPDISDGNAQLTGYNVYYYEEYKKGMDIPFSKGILIAHTTDTNLELTGAYTGVAWVTALYSEGESDPSNISIDTSLLPTDIQNIVNQKFVLSYNRQLGGIEIKGIENNIASVTVFRPDGTKVMFVSSIESRCISTKNLEKGIYIVQITMKDSQSVSKKILIE